MVQKKKSSVGSSSRPHSRIEELSLDAEHGSVIELDLENLDKPSAMTFSAESIETPDNFEIPDDFYSDRDAFDAQIAEINDNSVRTFSAQADDEAANGAEMIVGTAIGFRTDANGMPTGELAYKVYINKMGMRAGIRPSSSVGTEFKGKPIDVQVAGDIRPLAAVPQRFQRPVPCGCSISNASDDQRKGRMSAGTLGCLVVLNNGKLCILSNNHVLAGSNTGIVLKDRITQQGGFDGGGRLPQDLIGVLENFVPISVSSPNEVDAAVAFTSRQLVKPSMVGFSILPTPIAAKLGMTVVKNGRTTGSTMGVVTAIQARVPVPYQGLGTANFQDQIEITGVGGGWFSDRGDSGALVMTAFSKQPVGLLFAGGGQLTWANPISTVASAMGIRAFVN